MQGILISAVHPTQLNKQLRLLFKKGIPTITFNNDILGGPRIAYVGLNDRVAGAMAGELMSKYLFSGKDKSVFAILFRKAEKILRFVDHLSIAITLIWMISLKKLHIYCVQSM